MKKVPSKLRKFPKGKNTENPNRVYAIFGKSHVLEMLLGRTHNFLRILLQKENWIVPVRIDNIHFHTWDRVLLKHWELPWEFVHLRFQVTNSSPWSSVPCHFCLCFQPLPLFPRIATEMFLKKIPVFKLYGILQQSSSVKIKKLPALNIAAKSMEITHWLCAWN